MKQNEWIDGLSDEQYSAAKGLRSTEIKAAVRSSSHWKAYLAQPRSDTPALKLGRLAHLAVLQPLLFAETVQVRPDVGDLRAAKNRTELAEWKLGLPQGSVDVSSEDYGHLLAMADSAKRHPRLAQLLKLGKAEQSLFWMDDAHDLLCKSKSDWITESGITVDLKTCMDASPEVFAKDMMRYGYPISAACYLEGVRSAGIGNADTFVLVAIEKAPPYGIGLYTLGSDVLDWGHQWRHHAMANISKAVRTGQTESYPDHFQVLELPKWAPRPIEFADR